MSLNAEIFSSVNAVPEMYWKQLNSKAAVYFSFEFLSSYEEANKAIDFYYLLVLDGNEVVAFANVQLVGIGIETITKNIRMVSWLRQWINRLFCNNELRVLFCGNVFLSGEYGIYLNHEAEKLEAFECIAAQIKRLYKTTKKIHTIFIKDFEKNSLYITDHLKNYGYTEMQVEPNMIIYLNPEWRSFDDYKAALKSKYRIKANKADSRSAALVAREFTEKDIQRYKHELQHLYQNTIDNSDFNAQILNLETYVQLKSRFKDRFIVQGYFHNEKLIGFLSALQNGRHLDAHFIGLDYSMNKTLAIYPRILNDYVRIGISRQSQQINLGRTASEIKSTLGAEP